MSEVFTVSELFGKTSLMQQIFKSVEVAIWTLCNLIVFGNSRRLNHSN